MPKQIKWLTILKALGILSVVLGHMASPLGRLIYSFHMPLFFFIGGFFINVKSSFKSFVIRCINRLIKPYFLFAFIGVAVEILKRFFLKRKQMDISNEIIDVFIWMDYSSLNDSYAFALWFLPSLFFVKLFVYLLLKYVKASILQLILIPLLFILGKQVQLPCAIDEALISIGFTFLGYKYFRSSINPKIFFFFSVISVTVIALYFSAIGLDLANKYFENEIINVFWSISIIILLIRLAKVIQGSSFVSNGLLFIGSNSMMIYIFHPYTNNLSYSFTQLFFKPNVVVTFTLSLSLLLMILGLVKKYAPNFILFKYV